MFIVALEMKDSNVTVARKINKNAWLSPQGLDGSLLALPLAKLGGTSMKQVEYVNPFTRKVECMVDLSDNMQHLNV